jgi:urease accessory protein
MKPEVRIRSIRRASRIVRAGAWQPADALDRVVLDAADRHRRRIALVGERGTRFLLDLSEATRLRDGDGLLLDDGAIIAVVARPEPLAEIAAENGAALARLAWHLGNRHVEVGICSNRLRIRRDPVLEGMLAGLGAQVTVIEAPFDPEPGAYEHAHGGDLGDRDEPGARAQDDQHV